MAERARPPDDISPLDFFTRWVPDRVAADAERRERLGGTRASLVFVLTGVQPGEYTLHIAAGDVRGEVGRVEAPDLEVQIDCETWRRLNRGELSAPEALVRRRLSLRGDAVLALKLHLILS
jgi:putative sterol carrier protein